ncbi:LacI family transcriptional regulator [Rhodococcus sp. WS3]|uniref:LacI family DNA-binding transcriptional regulator n=1 Tax=unclassified Rhodococcus (in: high G+C Gram-positive bacteria) TaxID=192944 RepID=UPI0005D323A2|nr:MULTISPECIES: LacI family DNA-binding transcriptional regulator [unclassified Rhodococcus (in: high G+C Gram-positive bacteria)]KJF19256.1 Cryptic asc operon repressor [Rhodococcus sp. AD45]ROZ42777.1 LacI family transcriptional regulator [Rhodococcus sp. WS3]RZL20971.1 MAG: LacI family transcriptional regulator [Rhodococcus sp. (in: high G+C Gram-positive bacteria)]
MKEKPATLREVARLAQVSVTTVSDALSGSGRVAETTRTRIAAIAAGVGYVPNITARNLRSAQTGTIGFYLHPHLTELTFWKNIVMSSFVVAHELGYSITLLGPSDLAPSRLRSRVDGIVFSDPFYDHEPSRAVLSSGLPVVAIGRTGSNMPEPAGLVHARHDLAIKQLLDMMVLGGMTQPALLMTGDDYPSDWARLVTTAYRDWCKHRDLMANIWPLPVNASKDEIDDTVRSLVEVPGIDGLICARDGLALRAIRALHSTGRTVGTDFALAVATDDDVLEYLHPSITAIDLNPAGYVRHAIEMLASILSGGDYPREIVHQIQVIERDSSTLSH